MVVRRTLGGVDASMGSNVVCARSERWNVR